MKSLKELHEKYDVFKHKTNIHLSYRYDNIEQDWKFIGYKCSRCGRTIKRISTIESHGVHCKPIYTPLKSEQIEGPVITPERKLWKPLDFNQK